MGWNFCGCPRFTENCEIMSLSKIWSSVSELLIFFGCLNISKHI